MRHGNSIYWKRIRHFPSETVFFTDSSGIIEAARLDDASEWKIIVRIMIPMARTAISSIGLLSFISSWNSYFWPLVMTSSNTYRTLPIGVTLLTGSEGASQWPIVMAGNLMMVLPILLYMHLPAERSAKRLFIPELNKESETIRKLL